MSQSVLQFDGARQHRSQGRLLTIDELLNSIIWLSRDRPEALQEVLHHRDRLYRGLLRQLKSACDADEAGAR